MCRVIIYALGRLFQRYQDRINWESVIAAADEKVQDASAVHNVSVITPDQIRKYEYDYIAVFSDGMFEEIKCFLTGCHFIQEEKIISWRALVLDEKYSDQKIVQYYETILREFQFHKVLDVGMPLFPRYFFSTYEFLPGYDIQLDGVGDGLYPIERNLYQNVFAGLEQCGYGYDVALLWGTPDKIREEIRKLQGRTRFLLFHAPYSLKGEEATEKIDIFFQEYPVKKRISMAEMVFWLVDLSPKTITEDIGIYVVMHKAYQIKQDGMYRPICVGKNYQDSRFFSENKGENISYLNEKINECTALYWVWKNTNTKYVGLNHYRRYFYNNSIRNSGNYLDKETVYKFLQEYDIVLATLGPLYGTTVLEQVRTPLNERVCLEALEIVRDAMGRHQPDYVSGFDYVINSHKLHMCQMFVTRREIFDAYCEWLFSFLTEAAEEFVIDGYKGADRRAVGYWAERMLTTWLLKQNFRIKELPYVMV